jgi:hypothetical protein
MLGDDFLDEYGMHRRHQQQQQQRSNSRGTPSRSNSRTVSGEGSSAPAGDLGILKALGSMTSAAKRNLTQLAQGFNSGGGNNSGGRSTMTGFGGNNTSGGPVRRGSNSGQKKNGFTDLDPDVSK